MKTQEFSSEVATTVKKLFDAGNIDPSAEEIAVEHFGRKIIPSDAVSVIRKRLKQVKALLEKNYDLPSCLLSELYYIEENDKKFRHNPPTNDNDARLCLPWGYGKVAWGLLLEKDNAHARIWKAALDLNMTAGAGRVRCAADQAVAGVPQRRHAPDTQRGRARGGP